MDYNHNYEYEEEIDLIKLILFVFSKWRSIIACVLIGAVLGGVLYFALPNDDNANINNYHQKLSIVADNEEIFDSFMESFYCSGALYEIVNKDRTYIDIESMIEIPYDSSTKLYNTNLVNIYASSEDEVCDISSKVLKAIDKYISELYELEYVVIESPVENNIILDTQNHRSIVLYIIIGAFLGGIASAGVWFVVFFASGNLYIVSDIERKFRAKVLGSVAVCEKKNPIDKWIFHKMNGLYSEFSKEEQEKIVLLNIKNELKKNENIKKVMLVSSIVEEIKDAVQFIRTGLEEAGYIVSDCMNVIGRPDVMERAEEYDAAIVVESTTKSSTKLVAEENDVFKEYINNGLYMVML